MRKVIVALGLLFLICSINLVRADDSDITGFWETINKRTNQPSSVIAIYKYQGKYYGRIIATFNEDGEIDDTMYHPKSRAPGIVGDPFYSGIDIVFNVTPMDGNEGVFKGYITDPKKGKVYDAKLWREDKNLILRGEVFIFGKNIVWPPFPENQFNENFKKPDLSKFVPTIPQVK